jgi:solute carrier family 25 2-oxodicarboxylate transporter 21
VTSSAISSHRLCYFVFSDWDFWIRAISRAVPNQKMGDQHKLPWQKQVIAGAFAGLCEILMMYPLDVVKTRFQLTRAQNPSLYSAFRGIIVNEGPSRLYRGIAAPILAEAPKRAVKFTANEQYKHLLTASDGTVSTLRASMAGTLAGMTEAVINCPFEVVKVRMQAKENVGLYRSSSHAVTTILRTEGPLALYYGFGTRSLSLLLFIQE